MNKYAAVQKLIQLNFDMVKAYEAAIGGIDRQATVDKLCEFRDHHKGQTENLGAVLANYDQSVPEGPDQRRWLTQGKVVIADILGFEVDILRAIDDNARLVIKAYTSALELDNLDAATTQTLRANRNEVLRHREWITGRIASISEATATP